MSPTVVGGIGHFACRGSNVAGAPKIRSLDVANVSRFERLSLTFNDHFNLICGANGIGKTSVLNAIASFFIRNHMIDSIKRRATSESGQLSAAFEIDGSVSSVSGSIVGILPSDKQQPYGIKRDEVHSYLIFLKTNRDFAYQRLDSIQRDHVTNSQEAQSRSLHGLDASHIKNWFANRWLFRPHSQTWPTYQLENLDTAIECFSLLDSRVSLSHVDTATYEVMVNTPSGCIPFEYLSSGFRAAYAVLLGIIQEIETRPVERSAKKFPGIILIDELDLHLHPTWQQRFPGVIKAVFQNSQIIATTHSPHMIQTSGAHEVIALKELSDGVVIQSQPSASEYGYSGWSIEEILLHVMGLEDTVSPTYRHAIEGFDKALDADETEEANRWFQILDEMLHPSSHVRKLLRIQAASIGLKIDPDN